MSKAMASDTPEIEAARKPILSGWLVVGLMFLPMIVSPALAVTAGWLDWPLASLAPESLWRPAGFQSSVDCLMRHGHISTLTVNQLAAHYMTFAGMAPLCAILGLSRAIHAVANGFRPPSADGVGTAKRAIGILLLGFLVLGYGLDTWHGGAMSLLLCEHGGRFWIILLLLFPLSLGLFSILAMTLVAIIPVMARAVLWRVGG